jgi:small-conductance mechanosensitive channel
VTNRSIQRQLVFHILVIAIIALTLLLISSSRSPFAHLLALDPCASDTEGTCISVLKSARLLLWASLALFLIRTTSTFIFGLAYRLRKEYEAPNILRNAFSVVAYILVLTLIFKIYFPKVELAALITTSAVFSVIIGLALQETLGNFFAGISLHADKPFQIGDVITVGDYTGVVESVTWRAVNIRTFMDHVVQLDNSGVAKQPFVVCAQNELNAREIYFSTLYSDPPERTIRVVRDAVRGTPNISPKRAPEVNLIKFGDSGIDFRAKYWLEDYKRYVGTDAVVRQRVWYALQRAKITFPFPTRTLHIEPRAQRNGDHHVPPTFIERLSQVALFAPLSNDEITMLAEAAQFHTFTSGENLIHAGDEGASMFIIHRGKVEIQTSNNGQAHTIATLKQGDFFGEMALLKGEPRAADVVASEETDVLEIGYEAMKDLLTSNPSLVESLSEVITERSAGLYAGSSRTQNTAESASIIASIKKFFRLK